MVRVEQGNNMLSLIGYACGIAGGTEDCSDGPVVLQQANITAQLKQAGLSSYWLDMLYPQQKESILATIANINERLAYHTQQLCQDKKSFAVLGGDHSSAIGTWSGVSAALGKEQPFGLIWIDAHMDSHTFETTESGHIHGMPLACLLGHGASDLVNIATSPPKVLPQHVSLIGVRSYERGEAALLEQLGVRVYKMSEIKQRGLEAVIQEAVTKASTGTVGYGISIDLDAIDPQEAPGVSVPEPNGINGAELCVALSKIEKDQKLIGAELVEFNHASDLEQRTEKLIFNLLLSLFAK